MQRVAVVVAIVHQRSKQRGQGGHITGGQNTGDLVPGDGVVGIDVPYEQTFQLRSQERGRWRREPLDQTRGCLTTVTIVTVNGHGPPSRWVP